MNIEHMRCFLAVEQSMSFTVAADTLCISQSSLSKQIKALEGELNARLFDRGKKGIKLTPEGKKFSFYAGKMLGEYNDMLAALNDFPPKEKNLIRIACIQTMEQYGIGKMITAFQTENPGTEVSICEMDMVSVLRIFESSAADLAIMRGFSVPPGLYKAYPMLYDEMVFICSAGHRLACRESMNLSEASDDDFIF